MTIDAPASSTVGEERLLILELDPTNYSLVCNQSQLTVTVAGVFNACMPDIHHVPANVLLIY